MDFPVRQKYFLSILLCFIWYHTHIWMYAEVWVAEKLLLALVFIKYTHMCKHTGALLSPDLAKGGPVHTQTLYTQIFRAQSIKA